MAHNKVGSLLLQITEGIGDDCYEMFQPKGVAVVIHNDVSFRPQLNPGGKISRTSQTSASSKTDESGVYEKVMKSFCLQLGYYIISRSHLTGPELKRHMIGLSNQYHDYNGRHNSLLVVVSAQSNERGRIVTNDERKSMPISKLLENFKSNHCTSLLDKPKVFIFLMRVTVRDPVLPSLGSRTRKVTLQENEEDEKFFHPDALDLEDDFLVVRLMSENMEHAEGGPTFGGVSINTETTVPDFANTLLETLSEKCAVNDIENILKNVKTEIEEEYNTPRFSPSFDTDFGFKNNQNSHVKMFIDSTLRKKMYFLPGL